MNASRGIVDAADRGAVAQAAAGDPRSAMKTDDGFVAAFFTAPIANQLLRRIESSAVTRASASRARVTTALHASSIMPHAR